MRITVLTYTEDEAGKKYDVVVDQVAEALGEAGHEASILGVHGDVKQLIDGLEKQKPELVFNLLETFGGDDSADVAVAGLLDILGLRYTGSGPGELFLVQDKGLAKKIFAFEKILYPDFAVFTQDAGLETGGNLRMPLFVKPLRADASIGISGDSLVRDATALMKRVIMIHEKLSDAALVEEYIEGREFYVGVLGNTEPIAFPPVEMDFSGLPEGMPRILDSKAKWAKRSAEYKGTKAVLPELQDELKARLQKVALDAYRALRVRDYGRIDLRLTPTGEIFVIEANASCYLEKESEFATAAAAHGLDFAALVQRIAELAIERSSNGRP
jgi:D-alanine-D-alanine ligase